MPSAISPEYRVHLFSDIFKFHESEELQTESDLVVNGTAPDN